MAELHVDEKGDSVRLGIHLYVICDVSAFAFVSMA